MKNFLKKILNKISNLLFPEKIKCIFCGKDIPDFENKPYCNECEETLPFNNDHRCKICDMEIIGKGEVCEFCKHTKKSFDKSRAVFKYEDTVRKTVLKFKNNNAKYLSYPMARLMTDSLTDNMKDFDLILPVPLTEKALKKRGYNQSFLLANEIGKLTNKPVRDDILLKIKDTLPQKELSFKDRKKNLIGAFKVLHRKEIKDKNILLIDDVMTTSATANCCSDLLKRHCKKVYVLVFARNTINFEKNPKKVSKNT